MVIATDADPDIGFSGRRLKHRPSRQGHIAEPRRDTWHQIKDLVEQAVISDRLVK
jgi:hypothetical protein